MHKTLKGEILCSNNNYFNDAVYLNYMAEALNIPYPSVEEPVHNSDISDSLLYDGYQLFQFIGRCRDTYSQAGQEDNPLYIYYSDVFNKDSVPTLIEAALDMLHMDNKQKAGYSFWLGNKMQKTRNDASKIVISAKYLLKNCAKRHIRPLYVNFGEGTFFLFWVWFQVWHSSVQPLIISFVFLLQHMSTLTHDGTPIVL